MSDPIHPIAARGFDASPERYERARPGYPADAVRFVIETMRLRDARLVVDLAAGTGKFTKELVAHGVACVGVEPVEGMRRTFADVLPDVEIRDGSAEAMPFADASVDAVTIAQAFHWFSTDAALAEIARVLRPDGMLGLVWNARDDRVDWVARMTELFARYEGTGDVRVPRHRERGWREPLDRSAAFEPVAEREFANSQTLTPEGLVDRFASVSFIAVLDEEERARALAQMRELIATHPDLRGRDAIEHPYVTEVYVFRRAGRPDEPAERAIRRS